MFKKLGRQIGHKSGGKSAVKFKFEVEILQLDNVPDSVKKCRVVWSRGAKVAMTKIKDVSSGVAAFKENLVQVATMYRDDKSFEAKEYAFEVQVPAKGGEKMIRIGKAELDLARYANIERTSQNAMLPVTLKVGPGSTGYLKMAIYAEMLQGAVDMDGMTDVSAMTGLSNGSDHESDGQDLSGGLRRAGAIKQLPFRGKSAASKLRLTNDSPPPEAPMPPPEPANKSTSRASRKAADPPPAAETRVSSAAPAKEQGKKAAAASAATAASTTKAKKPVLRPLAEDEDDDDDVSPMSASMETSPQTSPRSSAAVSKASAPRKSAPVLSDADARALLFGSAPAAPADKPTAAARSSGVAGSSSSNGGAARSSSSGGARSEARPSVRAEPPPPDKPSKSDKRAKQSEASKARELEQDAEELGYKLEAAPEVPPVRRLVAAPEPAEKVAKKGTDTKRGGRLDEQEDGAAAPESMKQLLAENEKLRAQVAALKDASSSADESRRQARLKEQSMAGELEDCKEQVEELREQLKEVIASSMTPEEKSELQDAHRKEVDKLQQQLRQAGAAGADKESHARQLAELERQVQEYQLALSTQDANGSRKRSVDDMADRQKLQELEEEWMELENSYKDEIADLKRKLESRADVALEAQKSAAQLDKLQRRFAEAEAELKQCRGQLAQANTSLDEFLVTATVAEQEKSQLLKQVDHLKSELALLHDTPQLAAPSSGTGSPAAKLVRTKSSADADMAADMKHKVRAVQAQSAQMLKVIQQEVADLVAANAAFKPTCDQHMGRVVDEVEQFLHDMDGDESHKHRLFDVLCELRVLGLAQKSVESSSRSYEGSSGAAADHQQIAQLQAELKQARADLEQAAEARTLQQQQLRSTLAEAIAKHEQQLAESARENSDLRLRVESLQQQLKEQSAVQPTGNPFKSGKLISTFGSERSPSPPLIAAGVLRGGDEDVDGLARRPSAAAVEELQQQLGELRESHAAALKSKKDARRELKDTRQELRSVQQLLQEQLASADARSTQEQADLEREVSRAHRKIAELLQTNEKLELILAELEQKSAAEIEQLRGQLADAAEQIAALTARQQEQERAAADDQGRAASSQLPEALPTAIAAADNHDHGDSEQLHARLQELEAELAEVKARNKRLEKECSKLKRRMADEVAERKELEEQLHQQLQEAGDELAQEAVERYEAKYLRLKTKYRELEETGRDEIAKLEEELQQAQDRIMQLEPLQQGLEDVKGRATDHERRLAETMKQSSQVSADLSSLRQENEGLMVELVSRKLELAQLSEREVICRRELYKAKETNMKLASKMTKLEALVYSKAK